MDVLENLVEREKKLHRKQGFNSLLSVVTININTPEYFIDFGNDSAILLDLTMHPSVVMGDMSAVNILMMSDCDVRQGHVVNPSHLQHFLVRRFLTGIVTTNNLDYSVETLPFFPIMLKLLKITPTKE